MGWGVVSIRRQDDWPEKHTHTEKKLALSLSSGVFGSSIKCTLEVCQSRDDRDDPVPLTLFHYEFEGGLLALGCFGGMLCSLEEERAT